MIMISLAGGGISKGSRVRSHDDAEGGVMFAGSGILVQVCLEVQLEPLGGIYAYGLEVEY